MTFSVLAFPRFFTTYHLFVKDISRKNLDLVSHLSSCAVCRELVTRGQSAGNASNRAYLIGLDFNKLCIKVVGGGVEVWPSFKETLPSFSQQNPATTHFQANCMLLLALLQHALRLTRPCTTQADYEVPLRGKGLLRLVV